MNKTKLIVVVNSLCLGGVETNVVDLCNNIDKSRCDVTLLVLSNNLLTISNRVSADVKIVTLPITYRNSTIKNILALFLNIHKLRNLLRESNPDIIQTNTYQFNALPIFIALKPFLKKGAKHFHIIHSTGIYYQSNSLFAKIKLNVEKFLYKKFNSQVIGVSDDVLSMINHRFEGLPVKSVSIPNGIDLKKFERRNTAKNKSEILKVVYLARLNEGKAHNILIDGFAKALKENPLMELVLIGSGSQEDKLKAQTQDLKIERYVNFMGAQSNVSDILCSCDICVFPSEFEGFSIAMLEMAAASLPMICSRIDNYYTAFGSNDDNALSFEVGDSNTLAKHISAFAQDESLREEYGEKALNVAKQFSIEAMIEKYETLYSSIR